MLPCGVWPQMENESGRECPQLGSSGALAAESPPREGRQRADCAALLQASHPSIDGASRKVVRLRHCCWMLPVARQNPKAEHPLSRAEEDSSKVL